MVLYVVSSPSQILMPEVSSEQLPDHGLELLHVEGSRQAWLLRQPSALPYTVLSLTDANTCSHCRRHTYTFNISLGRGGEEGEIGLLLNTIVLLHQSSIVIGT